MQSELENEKASNYVGGNSTVLLFLLNTAVQNNQFVWEQARILNETVPGEHFPIKDEKYINAYYKNIFTNIFDHTFIQIYEYCLLHQQTNSTTYGIW